MSSMPAAPHTAGRRHPFGNPDGARADLKDVMTDFVGLDDESGPGALGDPKEDLTARIIVGRMGAGKTVYLRRSYAIAADDNATYADPVRNDLPSTEEVIRLSSTREPHLVTEIWSRVWRAAIMRALASHLLRAPHLTAVLPEDKRLTLEESAGVLLGRPLAPRSPYAEINEILHGFTSRGALDRYLNDPAWNDATWYLAEALRHAPPVYFHLDAIDEQFARAPMYWLWFQKGMFLAVMELLRAQDFGGRLHVVACVRDLVYSNVLRSEHASRYRDEPHIRVLEWRVFDIRKLLRAKIGRLTEQHRMLAGEDTVANWLGIATIPNARREIDEAVEDYLLRHTRLLPRDIVVLGNALSREVMGAQRAGLRNVPAETVRRVVHATAGAFADMQLRVCANQIASDVMPPSAVGQGFADFYLGDTEYARGMGEQLRCVVRSFESDRFDGLALERARRDAAQRIRVDSDRRGAEDIGIHTLDVLWQNGLLGYEEARSGDNAVFYTDLEINNFHLPLDKSTYVLHPMLAHTIELAPVGAPVRSW